MQCNSLNEFQSTLRLDDSCELNHRHHHHRKQSCTPEQVILNVNTSKSSQVQRQTISVKDSQNHAFHSSKFYMQSFIRHVPAGVGIIGSKSKSQAKRSKYCMSGARRK